MSKLTVEQIVQQCIGVIDMHRPRNGHASVENMYADKLIAALEQHFQVHRVNVNTLIRECPSFAEQYGLLPPT